MLNFILGFVGGVYVGTYNHQTCKPCLERITNCFKKEYDRFIESYDKDNKKSDDKDKE